MIKKMSARALLLALSFSTFATFAADGTINFTGTITDATCKVTPGSANQTVALGTVSSTNFTAAGSQSSPTKFNIVLTQCPASASTARIKFDGPADASNSTLIALTSGTGVATGVGVGIYEADGTTQIPVATASASKTLSTTANTTFSFIAKYVSTSATVTAGTANAVSNFTVTYN
ncbi:fimbrial protein [Type-D symbiont of Plautia stali]|uniref:fimbrial protein n=1 Tax=Type-D symbiont of Plautia stali TaxID=1560356 RepID=UPI000AD38D23|nr:fimbrial protein [Type-D symbiont of Plautia stali]